MAEPTSALSAAPTSEASRATSAASGTHVCAVDAGVHTGVDDEATQRCFAHIHDRVRATLVRGEPVTVAGGHPVRRTLKLLRALARGHWIVGEEYFTSPRARGIAASPSTPPPSRTEEGMLPHVPGAQLSRLSGGGRALAGLTVTLRGATVYFKSPLKPYLALF